MNNPAVFDELYNRYKSSLYNLACYLMRNQKEAEDLFQDTWLRIAKHLAHHTIDKDNCRTWIMTITSNLYRDWLRKKHVRKAFSFQRLNSDGQTDTHFEKPMGGGNLMLRTIQNIWKSKWLCQQHWPGFLTDSVWSLC